MVSLEQVKLLESKVAQTIDFVKKVTEENRQLKGKLDAYGKRVDELEAIVKSFKDEQSRIEKGILSALDKLNQFEDALDDKLSLDSLSSTDTKLSKDSLVSTDGKAVKEEETPKPPEENGGSKELDIF